MEYALEYARKGYAVLPLHVKGKAPLGTLVPQGVKDATTNLTTIHKWWTLERNANIGIATGMVSRLYVVDCDGPLGINNYHALTEKHGGIPDSGQRFVSSGGNGRHYYYELATPLGGSAGRLADKVDTRGDGGYVVAPPSLHPGGALYVWENWATNPRHPRLLPRRDWCTRGLPVWIHTALTAQSVDVVLGERVDNTRGHTKYGVVALEAEMQKLLDAPSGRRNQILNAVAYTIGQLVAGGELKGTTDLRDDVYRCAHIAGLSHDETVNTFRSGFNNGLAAPWNAPKVIDKSFKPRTPGPFRPQTPGPREHR